MKRLNSIGFEWDPQASAWDTKFEELVAFKRKNGVSKCMTLVCFGIIVASLV